MKKIGSTSTGIVIVGMLPQEFDMLEASLNSKKSETKSGPDAHAMSVKKIAEYAGPRLKKLGAKKKDRVFRSIAAMFQTTGGIDEEKISQTFSELVRMQVLQEEDGKITYT